jgi:hypothetical protein
VTPEQCFFVLTALNAVATWQMLGVILFVQHVHYPLFSQIGEEHFRKYHLVHCRRTGHIVGPLMLLEVGTALLMYYLAPGSEESALALVGLMLLGVIWISTALLQMPLHHRLALAYTESTISVLVRTNWIRTVAWLLRAFLVTGMLLARPIA